MFNFLFFMQISEVPIVKLLRLLNQFSTLTVSLKFIILDHGNRGKRVEESSLVKCLDREPRGCHAFVTTAEGSDESFEQPPQL